MNPKIFLEAAKNITELRTGNEYGYYEAAVCCWTLACQMHMTPYDDKFKQSEEYNLFKELYGVEDDIIWFGSTIHLENQNIRRLALLFAYEIAKENK